MFDWLWTPVMETNDKDGLSHGSSSEDTVMLPDPHRVTLGLHQLSHAILSSGLQWHFPTIHDGLLPRILNTQSSV